MEIRVSLLYSGFIYIVSQKQKECFLYHYQLPYLQSDTGSNFT